MNPDKTVAPTPGEEKSTERAARATIEEARIVTPGIQALFGFQLVAAFSERFRQLGSVEQELHFAALVLVALSLALIMTPAAYHRIAEPSSFSRFFVKLASRLIAVAMVPLMLALCLEVYIIGYPSSLLMSLITCPASTNFSSSGSADKR